MLPILPTPSEAEPSSAAVRRAAILGPWLLGLAIGVQLMVVGLIFFGPASPSAQDLARLTQAGLLIYQPEHDLPLYAAGCALSVALASILVWRWSRFADPERARGVAASQFAIAVGGTAAFFTILLLVREVTPKEVAPGAVGLALCLAVPLAALVLGLIGTRLRSVPRAAFRFFDVVATFAKPAPARPASRGPRLADFAMPLLIATLIYIPYPLQLAGKIYLADEFHHWDFFLMAPAIGFLHGGALGTDVFAQYGVGWPTLHAALASWWQLSYAHVFQVSLIYGCLYFIGIYIFLRLLVGSPAWAAAGVILTITLHLFNGGDRDSIIWCFPSSTLLRHPMDIWFFIAALQYGRTKRTLWAMLAGTAVGLAIFLETDTGLYLTLTCAGLWTLHLLSAATSGAARPWRPAALSLATAMLVAGGLLAVASRGTLLHGAFWAGWMESVLKYGGGIGMLPFTGLSNAILLFFVLIVSVYLFTFLRGAISAVREESAGDQTVVGCLAGYGLMTMLIFVGRTHPYNIFHASIAFSLVSTYWLARIHRHAPRVQSNLHRLIPTAAFAGALATLVCHDSFQHYPNILLGPGTLVGEGDLRIEAAGVGGLPHSKGRFAGSLLNVTEQMRALTAAGYRLAVFDHADPIYYLSSGAQPWFRYSPLLPFLLTKSEVDEVTQKLRSDPPDFVFLSNTEARAVGFKEQDARKAIRPVLQEHFTRMPDVGFFEVWRREQTLAPVAPNKGVRNAAI